MAASYCYLPGFNGSSPDRPHLHAEYPPLQRAEKNIGSILLKYYSCGEV
jgi:hypothetical protein